MTYVPGDWHAHRRLWSASETTLRKSLEERARDWDNGCGWCSEPYHAHDPFIPLDQRPVKPERIPAVVDFLMGRLSRRQYEAITAAAVLTPDAEVLPR